LLERLLDNARAARLFLPFPQCSTSYRKELQHWLRLKGEFPHKV
jgi:hypothetical protein